MLLRVPSIRFGKRFIASICASILVLSTGQVASAWIETSHMTVAYIADQHLTPTSRAAVDALPASHPGVGRLAEHAPADPNDRALRIFMRAVTWPDMIKGDPRFSERAPAPGPPLSGFPDVFRHRDWHYIDESISADGTATVPAPVPNAVTKITDFVNGLESPTVESARKTCDLPWLLHLVGDLKQPLHCTTRFSSAHPHGDNGGNGFKLANSSNLHSQWDGLLGSSETLPNLRTIGDSASASTPKPTSVSTNPSDWVGEGVELTRGFVYTIGNGSDTPPPTAPSTYRDQAVSVPYRHIARGGYCLVALLNGIFDPSTARGPVAVAAGTSEAGAVERVQFSAQASFGSTTAFHVPAGKRFVIEFVTARLGPDAMGQLATTVGGNRVAHVLAATPVGQDAAAPSAFAAAVRIYTDPDTDVVFEVASWRNGSGSQMIEYVTCSGYLQSD